MAYAIITENDESQWKDDTGALYHFPKRYKNYLLPGTEVIYYKGRIKNKDYSDLRLSDDPHYFAKALTSGQSLLIDTITTSLMS